ncbi:hypothetical protein ABZU75_11550 [Streptosporangium sp. NPDC005286]
MRTFNGVGTHLGHRDRHTITGVTCGRATVEREGGDRPARVAGTVPTVVA